KLKDVLIKKKQLQLQPTQNSFEKSVYLNGIKSRSQIANGFFLFLLAKSFGFSTFPVSKTGK
ncbi:MAG: hypothetical protein ACQETJ_14810, partial [Bacteroidota bacterium]